MWGRPSSHLLKACALFVIIDTTVATALFLRVLRMTTSLLEITARAVVICVAFSAGHDLKALVIGRAVEGVISGHEGNREGKYQKEPEQHFC